MSQSLVQVYVHIVFSTKDRRPFLQDKVLRDRAHAYLAKICHNQGSPSLKVGGVEDHHKHESFKDEFRRLCQLHGVAIDERYVWD